MLCVNLKITLLTFWGIVVYSILMRYLVLIIVLLSSFQVSTKEVWEPFGYKLGSDLQNVSNLENIYKCDINTLISVPLNRYDELKCYKTTTKNLSFKNIILITNLNNQIVEIIVDLLTNYIPQFKCTENLLDMRKLAIQDYNFKNDTSKFNAYTDYYDKEKAIKQKKMDYDTFYRWIEWKGINKDISIEIQCLGLSEDATFELKWWLNTIEKTPSIDTNI